MLPCSVKISVAKSCEKLNTLNNIHELKCCEKLKTFDKLHHILVLFLCMFTCLAVLFLDDRTIIFLKNLQLQMRQVAFSLWRIQI